LGIFQTGFAKVVEDMMKEQKASTNKQLTALNDRSEYTNSSEFEAKAREQFEGKALGSYNCADGQIMPFTIEG
jgi:hypothetical protein